MILILVVMILAACSSSDLSFMHRGFGFVPGPSAAPASTDSSVMVVKPSPSSVLSPASSAPASSAPVSSSSVSSSSPASGLPDIRGYIPTAAEVGIIAQINEQRKAASLPEFITNDQLCAIAHVKAQEMNDVPYFAHTSPKYGTMSDMLHSFSVTFQSMGENIARISDSTTLVKAWMDSPDHRQNILNARCKQVGVGVVGTYYVAVFTD